MLKSIRSLIIFLIIFLWAIPVHGGVIWSSSWNHATGSSQAALDDGTGGSKNWSWSEDCTRTPSVSSGGPGGNNYLNIPACNNMDWHSENDHGDQADLYIRFYFRFHADISSFDGNLHWFQGGVNASADCHYILHYSGAETHGTGFQHYDPATAGTSRWNADWAFEYDTWYRWEVRVQEVAGGERVYIRVDGVDKTDNLTCIARDVGPYSPDPLNYTLQGWYNAGGKFGDNDHDALWIASYDFASESDGWDVSSIEVRDDTWPGAVDEDTTPPTLSSATIAANGTTLTLAFDENVTQGSGYNDSDWDLDISGGDQNVSISYSSGDGTASHIYTISQTILSGETVDIDFNGDTDSMEDDAGNDLTAIVSDGVVNNSTQDEVAIKGISFSGVSIQ